LQVVFHHGTVKAHAACSAPTATRRSRPASHRRCRKEWLVAAAKEEADVACERSAIIGTFLAVIHSVCAESPVDEKRDSLREEEKQGRAAAGEISGGTVHALMHCTVEALWRAACFEEAISAQSCYAPLKFEMPRTETQLESSSPLRVVGNGAIRRSLQAGCSCELNQPAKVKNNACRNGGP